MKQMKKQIGSLLLPACLALTLLPCAALASADQITIKDGSFSNLIIPASNESKVQSSVNLYVMDTGTAIH